jgi:hypothetical protein
MEVNGLTTLPINQFAHQVSSSLNHTTGNEDIPVPVQRKEVKIENISMDLEEMKNFLFMMIRGGAVRMESDDDKIGRVVNKFA